VFTTFSFDSVVLFGTPFWSSERRDVIVIDLVSPVFSILKILYDLVVLREMESLSRCWDLIVWRCGPL
jgi:hypothetical protein